MELLPCVTPLPPSPNGTRSSCSPKRGESQAMGTFWGFFAGIFSRNWTARQATCPRTRRWGRVRSRSKNSTLVFSRLRRVSKICSETQSLGHPAWCRWSPLCAPPADGGIGECPHTRRAFPMGASCCVSGLSHSPGGIWLFLQSRCWLKALVQPKGSRLFGKLWAHQVAPHEYLPSQPISVIYLLEHWASTGKRKLSSPPLIPEEMPVLTQSCSIR